MTWRWTQFYTQGMDLASKHCQVLRRGLAEVLGVSAADVQVQPFRIADLRAGGGETSGAAKSEFRRRATENPKV